HIGAGDAATLGDPLGGEELIGQVDVEVVRVRTARFTAGRTEEDSTHALDAAGHAGRHRSGSDEGIHQVHRLQRGPTGAVDCGGCGLVRQAAVEPGGARDVVRLFARLGHTAADDLFDIGRVDPSMV